MGALTYIALLIIDGDEAYAGIIGDVLCRPRDINLRASFIKKAQSVARGIAHGFQLLPLTFVNYCGKKGELDNYFYLRALNLQIILQLSCLIFS